jgi:PPM family protein phosphatase
VIPAEQPHLLVAATSNPGMSGKNNEDRYAVSAYHTNAGISLPSLFAIVADGIGGHRAGEIAAEMAVEIISKTVRAGNANHPIRTLEQAVINASKEIYHQSETDFSRKGMGATCACCWIIGDQLYTVCVGDTRIYLIRGGTIRQLSTDHTWIQEAIDHGALSPEQAQGHPNAHVIRRYLGSRQPVVPDFRLRLQPKESDLQARANQGMRLLPGDQLIICSDGLTDLVEDAEVLSRFSKLDQQQAIDQLVDLANQRGGHDNITIVALQMPEFKFRQEPAEAIRTSRRLGIACLGLGGLLTLSIALIGGLYWIFIRPAAIIPPTQTNTITVATEQFISPLATTPAPTATTFLQVSETPFQVLTPSPTLHSATLTPWPTNTGVP